MCSQAGLCGATHLPVQGAAGPGCPPLWLRGDRQGRANPDLVRIIRTYWREFSGNIYGDRTFTGLGRSWLKGRGKSFDIIDISLLGTEPSGSSGIAEDYRFTVEAFREYL
jgi:hypothetical protein